MKKFIILLVVIFLLFGSFSTFALAQKEVTVGAKNFTEQYVLNKQGKLSRYIPRIYLFVRIPILLW